MRKKIIVGNWKMNGRIDSIKLLLHTICQSLDDVDANCVVLPPAIYLPLVRDCLVTTPINWGAQNVYSKNMGAYTGELSAPMLKDYGCQYVLVGHSERRTLFAENEKFIAEKFHHVKEHDMIPILCVGETLSQRKQGLTNDILVQQLQTIASDKLNAFSNCIIAYEPVWAIGTGQTASPEQVQDVHSFIRTYLTELDEKNAKNMTLLYGGSVNEKNAQRLFTMPDVDGGLIGGASLNAQQFVEIVKCIN